MGLVSLGACVAGFVLDFIFGDPVWLYHPVRLIGKWISFLEKLLRRKTGEKRQIAAGGILWILTVAVVYSVTAGILWIVRKWGPAAGFILETFWCYQIFAARCLVSESGKVYERLKEKDLPGSRKAVSMIVGRDTENLSFEGVTKAAVETVAENTSDGVTAPLLYLLLGGAPLGFLYKAVNTMDSMLGYKNETYLYFGRIPAKMDDLFNYIPARLTAWFMVLASFLTGLNGKNAWKIYRRDCRKHASPNSAQSEAVCAGALDVQLAGDAVYFGKIHKKEFIGDPLRKIEAEEFANLQIVLTQMQNFMKSNNAQPIGPMIQCVKIPGGPNPQPEVYMMQQTTQLIPRMEPGYTQDAVLRVRGCLYAHYTGPMSQSGLASQKLNIFAFENELELNGNVYTIFVNQDDDDAVVDVFMETK